VVVGPALRQSGLISRFETTHTPKMMNIESNASGARYAQVWEDADTLLEGLDIQPGDVCLSIASGGDNTLAMLAKQPGRVIAIDRNPAQLFCLELKVAAFKCLDHESLLQLMGSRAGTNRTIHYEKCRPLLSHDAKDFWDKRRRKIEKYGIGGVGRFERYLRIFRRWILPIGLSKDTVANIFVRKEPSENERYFDAHWKRSRLKLLIRIFVCRPTLFLFGRDVVKFTYINGKLSDHILEKIVHGFRELRPAENPYLHWILCGTHGDALPFAFRRENFEPIRRNIQNLEWRLESLANCIDRCQRQNIRLNRLNLSNIFDYLSEDEYFRSLRGLVEISAPGARMLYWNMMVPRSRPRTLESILKPLGELAARLHEQDKAIFYSKLNIEEVA
jgi:S-adenosylmethionine:diacylglycerol 3-amino-3-carboxypropyl transferase